jgi:ketosteroid isomerase-like protein
VSGLGRTIPALPVRRVADAVPFYRDRLGFEVLHHEDGFAVMRRDGAVLHLWEAGDEGWRERDSLERPVRSGAESFIAGTASCRIEVERVDELFEEMRAAGVLHPVSRGGVEETGFGTREFAPLDGEGNLLTFYRWVGTDEPRDVMRRYLDAMRRGDWDAGTAFFADDIVIRIPGRSEFAGEHRGRQAAVDYIAAAVARAHGREVEVELVDTLVSGDRVALLVRERFGREGGALEITRANVYRVRGGRIAEIAIYEGDQYEVDELMAGDARRD